MEQNTKSAWAIGFLAGVIGIIVAAVIYLIMILLTGWIFGIVTIFAGAIAGGAVGLGFKIGKGTLKTEEEIKKFLRVLTIFGALGVLAAYGLPTLFGIFFDLTITDIIFVIIGAYGGRWAGKNIARHIIMSEAGKEAIKKIKEEGVKNIDTKFK